MTDTDTICNPNAFSEALYKKMKAINPGIAGLELYEFRYGLDALVPVMGWESIQIEDQEAIELRVNCREFYDHIQLKPRMDGQIVLDTEIVRLAQMLFVGLVTEKYSPDWIRKHFYFDIRGFYFLHRTRYFTDPIRVHFGAGPFQRFEPKQTQFERLQDLGYKAFKKANREVDRLFIESVMKIIAARGVPILVAIAGPTAAGKTEIVERLCNVIERNGKKVASIELDNFLTDRDYREQMGIHTEGKQALHLELLIQALEDITHGKKIRIPRYDFVHATSSHDLAGCLKAGGVPVEIEPADIIFIEGNFPFLLEDIVNLIGIKVVYLTDDPVRLKRKWKRDIDFRKKYEPTYFRNRYFKDQYIMAEIAYRPQMEVCDMIVDTTDASFWVTPEFQEILSQR
jgi:uridine kinase